MSATTDFKSCKRVKQLFFSALQQRLRRLTYGR